MEIKFDYNNVVDIEYHIEDEGIWTISFTFKNGDACTYGYTDLKRFVKDCTEIANARYLWED